MERRSRVAKPVLHRYRLRLARASGRRAEGVVNRGGGASRSTPPGAGKCEVRCEIKGARPQIGALNCLV